MRNHRVSLLLLLLTPSLFQTAACARDEGHKTVQTSMVSDADIRDIASDATDNTDSGDNSHTGSSQEPRKYGACGIIYDDAEALPDATSGEK